MPQANNAEDKVRRLQVKLYQAAKHSPARRFHALYDKVYRDDILHRAWEQVRRNRGAAGVDGVTIAQVEAAGVDVLLNDLAEELKESRGWLSAPGRAARCRCSSSSIAPGRP